MIFSELRTNARTGGLDECIQAAGGGRSGSGGGGRRGRNGMTVAAGLGPFSSPFGAVESGSWLVMGSLSQARGQTSAVKNVKAVTAVITDSDTAFDQAAMG